MIVTNYTQKKTYEKGYKIAGDKNNRLLKQTMDHFLFDVFLHATDTYIYTENHSKWLYCSVDFRQLILRHERENVCKSQNE